MRNRKSQPETNSNDVSNGKVRSKQKTKPSNKNNQQMLVNVLLGFVGFVFACGILIFMFVDLSPVRDTILTGRSKTAGTSKSTTKDSVKDKKQPRSAKEQNTKLRGETNAPGSKTETPKKHPINENPMNDLGNEDTQNLKISNWRPAENKDLTQYGSNICNIEKRKAETLTKEEFESVYRYKKPLIVQFKHGAADWTKPDKWTVSSLKREYGDSKVFSGNAREIVRKGGNGEIGTSLSEFVDKLINKRDGTGEHLYVFDRDFFRSTSLPKTLKPPEYFQIKDDEDDSIFFLGASTSGVSFHKHADSWNGVIFGRKRWFLYPIEKTPPGGVFSGYTMLEWYETIYPKLKAASDKPIECIQEAGEILYLPEGFYHGTINLGDTVAIGIQKKDSTLEAQKLFYEDRQFYRMIEKSTDTEKQKEWIKKIIELYEKILKLLPDNTEVMNHLAYLYTYVNRLQDSLSMVDKVLKRDQYFVMSLLLKSDLLYELNRPVEAEDLLQEALLLNPNLFDTRVRYGNLLYNMERAEEAVYHYKKATELNPSDITVWNYLKNSQIASGDDSGAEETDQIITYVQDNYQ